ncbi:MAG: hypothetical protein WA655_14190 [Candidatus Korobacteraceae bacterium]
MSFSALHSRISTPQLVALLLLLAFACQCVWFSAHQPLSALEALYVEAGLLHMEGYASANTADRTALVPLLAGGAARVSGAEKHVERLIHYRFVMRLPFVLIGLLLGASVWYVARRLYGNIGGYVALGLYCFSPLTVGSASQVGPAIVGAWGGFGLIFTSIAVAHTLYAPREVVLWNWRRILLLGLSIAICVGAQFSFWILLLPALLFMLWVGHVRPGAALAIFAAACAAALIFLSVLYRFRPVVFAKALIGAHWLEFGSHKLVQPGTGSLLRDFFLQNGLGLVLLMAVSLITFLVWKRTRFFGTAAPLIVGVLVFTLALRMPFSAYTFLFLSLPFLILFMAGISADLLEGQYALGANAVVFGVLIANAMIDVYGLLNLTSRSR